VKILIVSATGEELRYLLHRLDNQIIINDNLTFCNFKKNDIYILITGLSYVSLIYYLTATLCKYRFDIVFNAGIAGSYNESIPKGSTVNVLSEVFSDFLIEDNNKLYTLFEKGLINKNDFPFKNGKLVNETISKNEIINKLPKVSAITSNTIHGNIVNIKRIKEIFNPDIETMEGAGFFYSCLMEKVPFFQIRTISNMVEPLNRKNWEINSAIKLLNDKLIEIIEQEIKLL
jgi:futalosine hydrolase